MDFFSNQRANRVASAEQNWLTVPSAAKSKMESDLFSGNISAEEYFCLIITSETTSEKAKLKVQEVLDEIQLTHPQIYSHLKQVHDDYFQSDFHALYQDDYDSYELALKLSLDGVESEDHKNQTLWDSDAEEDSLGAASNGDPSDFKLLDKPKIKSYSAAVIPVSPPGLKPLPGFGPPTGFGPPANHTSLPSNSIPHSGDAISESSIWQTQENEGPKKQVGFDGANKDTNKDTNVTVYHDDNDAYELALAMSLQEVDLDKGMTTS